MNGSQVHRGRSPHLWPSGPSPQSEALLPGGRLRPEGASHPLLIHIPTNHELPAEGIPSPLHKGRKRLRDPSRPPSPGSATRGHRPPPSRVHHSSSASPSQGLTALPMQSSALPLSPPARSSFRILIPSQSSSRPRAVWLTVKGPSPLSHSPVARERATAREPSPAFRPSSRERSPARSVPKAALRDRHTHHARLEDQPHSSSPLRICISPPSIVRGWSSEINPWNLPAPP